MDVKTVADIIRITLLTQNRQKFFEADAPIDNPSKVRDLLLLAKSKGVNLNKVKQDNDGFDWWG